MGRSSRRKREHRDQVKVNKKQEIPQPNFGINYLENVTCMNNGEAGIYVENTILHGKNIKLIGNKGGGLVVKHSIVNVEKDGLKIE
jgi:hypothetical protein